MVIARYLAKELLLTLAVVLVVLMLVFLSNQFVRYLSAAALGQIPARVLLQVLVYEMPHLLGLLVPLAFYLAILLAYGRMYSDSEMLVLHVCGFSRQQLVVLTFRYAVVLCIAVLVINFFLTPLALEQRDKLLANADFSSFLATILPGRFQQNPTGDTVFFIEKSSRNNKQMHGVFVAKREAEPYPVDGGKWAIISANSAYQYRDPSTGNDFIVVKDGYRYVGVPGQRDYQVNEYKEYGMQVTRDVINLQHRDTNTLGLTALWKAVLKGDNRAVAELQWRVAMPVSVLWLTLLGVSLSWIKPRQGRYSRLLPAILLYSCYANVMFLNRAWLQKGAISPVLGMCWVQGLFMLLSILVWDCFAEQSRVRRVLKQLLVRG